MKTAEFGQPAANVPQPGKCRICKCTDDAACMVPVETLAGPVKCPCGWADSSRTLCDNPDCIAEAKRELGLYSEGEARS